MNEPNVTDHSAAGESTGAAADDVVLRVEDMSVDVSGPDGPIRLVDNVSFELEAGQRATLVGESGSGKSVTAMSLLRLVPGATVTGRVLLDGDDLVAMRARKLRRVRGARVGMVFQDPLASLDPVMSIGDQVAESLAVHGTPWKQARARARTMLDELGVQVAGKRFDAHPHELSGGMRQRVMLAAAMLPEPSVLVADEPTTALDVEVQDQVMGLIDDLARDRGIAILLITHDLGVAAGFADKILVMYAGRLVEVAATDGFYRLAAHPYSRALLRSVPRVDADLTEALQPVEGAPPTPTNRPSGCAFHPRCPHATDVCTEDVPTLQPGPGGEDVACHHAFELDGGPR